MTESQAAVLSPAVGASQVEGDFRLSWFQAHMELGKVRLSAMVVFTTALGFVVASKMNPFEGMNWTRLFWTCLGTFLAAVGAAAFNQAIEARRDARMMRTRKRPLPLGALTRTYAATFGLIVCISGVAILCPTSNSLTAFLAIINILLYAVVYTPLKPISTTNTLVGAVVGGIPPMMGWAAATGGLSAGAWVLGAILFVWQIPHFLALSWMYRDDYARGGFRMLPVIDPQGKLTGLLSLLYSMLLVPLCLLLVRLGHAGFGFAFVSLLLTGGLIACAIRFCQTHAHRDARRLFLGSIVYLPLLTMTLMVMAQGPFAGLERTPAAYVVPTNEAFIEPSALPAEEINATSQGSPAAQSSSPQMP
jgi:protoheme IX farnesyltransferase